MKKDLLQKFIEARTKLERERETIQKRLLEIDNALRQIDHPPGTGLEAVGLSSGAVQEVRALAE